jgi:malonyl-CoA/methylmalonyl-CoA synthetase|tara:strand:+ start:423 stop:1940 length:1518 start_codon:yes stop_codon:yes gene_type:complete
MNNNLYQILFDEFKNVETNICIDVPGQRKWSYKDIDVLSSFFVSYLRGIGLKKGDRIISQTEKSVASVGLYLACLRSGVIYTPLNTSYTISEVEYFIENIQPKLFVCSPERLKEIISTCKKLEIPNYRALGTSKTDPFLMEILELKQDNILEQCSEDDTAAILFTSGTTGKSKGAMITHGNLSSNAFALKKYWGFTGDDTLLHALPIFHVHGLFVALHTALLSASKIIFLEKFDIPQVNESLKDSSVMMGVPTFYSRLIGEKDFDRGIYEGIRLFISGSAPLTEKTFNEFKDKTGHLILERYGMTETGMITSNPLVGERVEGTVGFSLPDIKIRARKDNKILSPNEKGVIEVKGPNVFKGYWQMEDKTKEEFTDDGFFITGDIGQIDESGRLTLSGRSGDMIISGGYNVYPKEIEIILNTINGIQESAVIGAKHEDFGECPIAILVSDDPDNLISDNFINSLLQESLAKYKIPKSYIWINSLPINAMGKVQKKDLRNKYDEILLG